MKAISGKHFCKILERRGWILRRTTKSSHFIYTKPGVRLRFRFPFMEIKISKEGFQADLMKQAGLTESDL